MERVVLYVSLGLSGLGVGVLLTEPGNPLAVWCLVPSVMMKVWLLFHTSDPGRRR